jgi:hypothetical protein
VVASSSTDLLVGRHHRVVQHAYFLGAKEHFRRARLGRIGLRAEDMPQQDLRQLMDEQRRHVDAFTLEQTDIGRLEGRGIQQAIAKPEPYAQIVARVGIDDGGDLVFRYPRARIGQQRLVQCDLGAARLAHRGKLRPQQVSAQEVVANAQAPIVIDGEQTVPAGGPEIGHGRTIACGRAGGRARRRSAAEQRLFQIGLNRFVAEPDPG